MGCDRHGLVRRTWRTVDSGVSPDLTGVEALEERDFKSQTTTYATEPDQDRSNGTQRDGRNNKREKEKKRTTFWVGSLGWRADQVGQGDNQASSFAESRSLFRLHPLVHAGTEVSRVDSVGQRTQVLSRSAVRHGLIYRFLVPGGG